VLIFKAFIGKLWRNTQHFQLLTENNLSGLSKRKKMKTKEERNTTEKKIIATSLSQQFVYFKNQCKRLIFLGFQLQ